ncbi:hypothetical protein N7468_003219 [Penicillium chermesinum]|uniref:Uncharacterized protein n=1 Tax=Penicillium chermesinum TaxID=63820 RepID=A0A9W9TRD7_9EURO|nr:uncharacterized protein N7468_003219 [Penicillium chermesinum]KAJ5238600.1 hypothetical protein N7468_003219 [Penicillium chermesinum]
MNGKAPSYVIFGAYSNRTGAPFLLYTLHELRSRLPRAFRDPSGPELGPCRTPRVDPKSLYPLGFYVFILCANSSGIGRSFVAVNGSIMGQLQACRYCGLVFVSSRTPEHSLEAPNECWGVQTDPKLIVEAVKKADVADLYMCTMGHRNFVSFLTEDTRVHPAGSDDAQRVLVKKKADKPISTPFRRVHLPTHRIQEKRVAGKSG